MNVLVFVQLILRPTQDKNQEFPSAPILAVPDAPLRSATILLRLREDQIDQIGSISQPSNRRVRVRRSHSSN